jgi:hypothetical protein
VDTGQRLGAKSPNRSFLQAIDFVNNKYQDPITGRTIFNNKRKVVTNAKDKTKRKIYFYYGSSSNRKESPESSTKTEFWQAI